VEVITETVVEEPVSGKARARSRTRTRGNA
jgi:hypothetical protein